MADAATSPTFVGVDDSDEASFVRFVETTKTSLYSYAVTVTRDQHLAWDVLQDTYVELFKRWSDLRREKPDGNGLIRREYVFTIILNKFRSHLRSLDAREAREENWVSEPSRLIGQPLTDDECIFNQVARELWVAVGELDPIQQSLISLVYVEGKSITKAGERLGLASTTARRHHNKALEMLRRLIGGEE